MSKPQGIPSSFSSSPEARLSIEKLALGIREFEKKYGSLSTKQKAYLSRKLKDRIIEQDAIIKTKEDQK